MATENEFVEPNPIALEDDEEEQRRLGNRDLPIIPMMSSNRNNQKKQQELVSAEQIEHMQRLLNDRTSLFSDEQVNSMQNFWALNKIERQTLYRYWLRRYLQKLRGMSYFFYCNT